MSEADFNQREIGERELGWVAAPLQLMEGLQGVLPPARTRVGIREDGRLWIAALCVAGLELADGFPVTSFSQVDITQRLMGQWIIDVKFECALDFYHCRILLSGEREEFGQRTSEPGRERIEQHR